LKIHALPASQSRYFSVTILRTQDCLLKKFNFLQENTMAVTNVAELNALVERVKKAQREYANFSQQQVDAIFRAAALAAADA